MVVKKIVVGVDGSRCSRVALRWALEEARYRNLPLLVVMAYQPPLLTTVPLYGVEPGSDELQDEQDQALLGVLREEGLLDPADVDVMTRVVNEASAPALLMAAEPDDILVVGSRGHGEVKGWLLGSVSRHCVNHARCPVVVVPVERGREG
jgi:nucleotide-binding universal stress UspA family protein